MQPVARVYEKFLTENKLIDQSVIDEKKNMINTMMEEAYVKSKSLSYESEDWQTEEWGTIKKFKTGEAAISGVPVAKLRDLGTKISTLPEDGQFHRLVKKIFEGRVKSIQDGEGIDWGTAEALAFSTLIDDGFCVRISGQDVERGTFSHRHAHVFYQDKDGYHNPINEQFQKKDVEAR